jgi:hypothetical protein
MANVMYQPDLSFISNAVPLRSIGDFANDINSWVNLRNNIKTSDSKIDAAKANAENARSIADENKLGLQNKQFSTYAQALAPYASHEHLQFASGLNEKSSPEDIKKGTTGLLEVGDNVKKELIDRGMDPIVAAKLSQQYTTTALNKPWEAPQMLKQFTQQLAGAQNTAQQNQVTYGSNQAGQTTALTPATGQMNVVGQRTSGSSYDRGNNSTQDVQDHPINNGTNAGSGWSNNANPSQADVSFINSRSKDMQADATETQEAAKRANQTIGTLQNIKQLSDEAFVGKGADVKAGFNGYLQFFGLSSDDLNSTQELMKNEALLKQIGGGSTDLGRQIVEAANPNSKMTPGALKSVANQLIGVQKMAISKNDYLNSASNPTQYRERLQKFNSINDPRIFQDMSQKEMEKMASSMSPKELNAYTDKLRKAHMMGILK